MKHKDVTYYYKDIEIKVVKEAFFVGSTHAKRKIVHTAVSYQGQPVAINE